MRKFFSVVKIKNRQISAADAAFMSDIQASLLSQATPGSRKVIWLILIMLISAVIWANLSRVEEITQGEGRVISQSREQVIQSLEGGILAEINAREGNVLEKGDVLLKIDPTRAQSSYNEALNKEKGLKATIARLRAEAYDLPLIFDSKIQQDPVLVSQETKAFESRRRALKNSIEALERSYALSMKEITLAQPLTKKGLLSEVEIIRMQRQANDIQSQIVERKNKFHAEANSELIKLELELSQTSENLIGRADIWERTVITAPVRGTVKNVRVTTIGGVIQPGEPIMELVPLEEQLLVEGKIRPSDVAFIREGMPATVKITAYDYSIYGGLKGTVTHISPDTLKDDQKVAQGNKDDTYYRVLILTEKSFLKKGMKELSIMPGMIASVEIRTGDKTILNYLLKPVMKYKEAFRER